MNAVDTNVLVYAQDPRDGAKREKALELVGQLDDAVLLWQVACEFVAASRKLATFGFTPERAWRLLDEINHIWGLTLPDRMVLEDAKRLMESRSISFWDSLLVAACLRAGVRRLYSEDFGDPPPSIEGLEIVNPFRDDAPDPAGGER